MTRVGLSIVDEVAAGTLDAELAALLWLLVEAGDPVTVIGDAGLAARQRLAEALLSVPPDVSWTVLDADVERPGLATLGARLRGGMRLGLTLGVQDLRGAMERLSAPPDGLPEDAVRRLGTMLVVDDVPTTTIGPVVPRLRVVAAHHLRPLERDAQGHLQRRPPAVLAAWRPDDDTFDHFAWGVTPELADLVDRTQASFEDLQASRASAIRRLAGQVSAGEEIGPEALSAVLAAEPPRQVAPARTAAQRSTVRSPLTDPHVH